MAEAVGGSGVVAAFVIKVAHQILAFGNGLLNVTQQLLGLIDILAVGKLHDQLAAFVFRAYGLGLVAIGLVHLLIVDLADLLLRFGGLFHGGIEQDEILVLGFGLRQTGGAAFPEPTVGDGKFGFGEEFALIVGINQGVERDARDFVAAVLDVADGAIEQNLIGLFGV